MSPISHSAYILIIFPILWSFNEPTIIEVFFSWNANFQKLLLSRNPTFRDSYSAQSMRPACISGQLPSANHFKVCHEGLPHMRLYFDYYLLHGLIYQIECLQNVKSWAGFVNWSVYCKHETRSVLTYPNRYATVTNESPTYLKVYQYRI